MPDAMKRHLTGFGLYSNPKITDDGVKNLERLRSLETLQLQFTQISDDGLALLGQLPALRFLDIRGTQVSPETARAFDEAHAGCKVYR